jgi:hypothetical protein
MARVSRFGGAFRVGYGASAIGAGISKIGRGSFDAYQGIKGKPFKPLRAGKGFETIYAGARAIRAGFRNVRSGVHSARGQTGHPFYGNQHTRVMRRAVQVRTSYVSARRGASRRFGAASRGASRGRLSSGRALARRSSRGRGRRR